MPKHRLLLTVLTALLLVGCLGPAGYHFDDSPTVLEITLKRTSADNTDPTNAKVQIWKANPDGKTIYSLFREVPIESGVSTYTLTEEVPAKSAYRITAMYANHEGFFEFGERMINAPRQKITTVTVNLAPIDVSVHAPDKLYSGGSLGQFSVELPDEHEHQLSYGILIGSESWSENGQGGDVHLDLENTYLPNVDEAQKMYYQMVVFANDETYIGERPTAYYPDLNSHALPYVWIYP